MRKIAALPLAALLLSGCGLLGFTSNNAAHIASYASPYEGLPGKKVAIIVYADPATLDEYPGIRREISDFLADELRLRLSVPPNILEPQEVIYWQTDTLNWTAISEKDIGRHFAVDRVLF